MTSGRQKVWSRLWPESVVKSGPKSVVNFRTKSVVTQGGPTAAAGDQGTAFSSIGRYVQKVWSRGSVTTVFGEWLTTVFGEWLATLFGKCLTTLF